MSSTSLADLPIFERADERYRRLPSCLKSQRIWYPSKFIPRPNGRLGKPPCNRQGKLATQWQYKSNWMSFDEAVGLDMDGVGIVLHEKLVLTGIDFDHCVQDGVIIDPWVAQKAKELDSYTEYSVSGTGIHVLVWGRLPGEKCEGDKIEMYDGIGSRFLVMTGNLVPGTPTEIRSAQDTIDALHLEVFGSGEQISGKNSPFRINRVTIPIHREEEGEGDKEGKGTRARGEGEGQWFEIWPAIELTQDEWVRLNDLRDKLLRFKLTWAEARATSPWPFKSRRYTSSEYEASIAFFLIWDGWSVQSVMNAICVWRRERGKTPRTDYFRYACTIGKAVAMVTPRSKVFRGTRKELKGAWKHGYTRDRILSCIIETPRTSQQIADITGIDHPHVKVIIGRLRKDNKVIRDHHTYLCAPTAVPWYLRNIPDDAGEDIEAELMTPEDARVDLDTLEAEYAAAVSTGMFDYDAMMVTRPAEDVIIGIVHDVDEDTEAPVMVTRPAAVIIKHVLSDFDDYVEPEPVTVEPIDFFKGLVPIDYGDLDPEEGCRPEDFARYRRDMAAWEINDKKERLELYRKARKNPNYKSMAKLKREAKEKKKLKSLSTFRIDDRDNIRLEELEAERARLRRLDDKEDTA